MDYMSIDIDEGKLANLKQSSSPSEWKRIYETVVVFIYSTCINNPEIALSPEEVRKCRACRNHYHIELEKLCGKHCPHCDSEATFGEKIDLSKVESREEVLDKLQHGSLEDFANA